MKENEKWKIKNKKFWWNRKFIYNFEIFTVQIMLMKKTIIFKNSKII